MPKVTLDLDTYSTLRISTTSALTLNNPTVTGSEGRITRSGIIFIKSFVPSIAWGTNWKFGAGITPPGGQDGAVLFTVYSSTVIMCQYIRAI